MLKLLLTLMLASVLSTPLLAGLQAPTLTQLSPNSVVSPGEVLQFSCTTPNKTCISVDFSLYKDQTLMKDQAATCPTTFTLTVDASHQGQYTCDYSYRGSASTSSRSNAITITVVNLQQPNISFNAAGGWLYSRSDGAEVIKGYNFSINCSTTSQYPGGSFHLKFSESNIKTQPAVNHSAVFLYPEADFVHQGNYSCTYEVKVSSRTFTSTATERLFITVKGIASQAPYIGVGVTAGLLLILVPVIICFVKRQKRRKYQMHTKKEELSQRAEDSDQNPHAGDEEDDEPDYINAETIFRKEEDSDDSDNVYLNVATCGQRSALDNDYEDEGIYANCAEKTGERNSDPKSNPII